MLSNAEFKNNSKKMRDLQSHFMQACKSLVQQP